MKQQTLAACALTCVNHTVNNFKKLLRKKTLTMLGVASLIAQTATAQPFSLNSTYGSGGISTYTTGVFYSTADVHGDDGNGKNYVVGADNGDSLYLDSQFNIWHYY